MALASWARRDGLRVEVTGIDPDERAHEYAASRPRVPGVTFERAASRDLVAEGRRFDLVFSNHVVHHLDAGLSGTCSATARDWRGGSCCTATSRGADLPYGAYALATTGTFRGSFIHADGLMSIRRSYRPDELRRAVPAGWRVESPWPFRLLLSFTPETSRPQEPASA